MFGLFEQPAASRQDHSACSGCSLCVLVCPMWRARRDPRFSPEGLAKALQCGATVAELAAPLDACSLCGACDPVCPERIDLSGMVMALRGALPRAAELDSQLTNLARQAASAAAPVAGALLLPGADLRANPALLARTQMLLGYGLAQDDGADIALALETGAQVSPTRRRRFLDRVEGRTLIVGDGLLLAALRRWLHGVRLQSLGEALSSQVAIRRRLTSADFYVIETRAYHAEFERLVTYYDRLRLETGCALNLDLQRIAIPAMTQAMSRRREMLADEDLREARWMLKGRQPRRIVVESLADRAVFEKSCDVPVLHLAELAED
ncbi:MAG: 4Fe-4S dicluster domain-containing protein [Burkholderiaceae bacterium]|nr:4Fe-4S dicluster domain-containing protein [Sulfuritalea sp.]MCF8174407.1 4Fe-4S dicluster domain-containing protein [Burkholderiaceae bacterium]